MGVNKSPSASLKSGSKPGKSVLKSVPKDTAKSLAAKTPAKAGFKATAKAAAPSKTLGSKAPLKRGDARGDSKGEAKSSSPKSPGAKLHAGKQLHGEKDLQGSKGSKAASHQAKSVSPVKSKNSDQDLRLKKGKAPAKEDQPNFQRGADARAALEKLNRASGKSKVISSTGLKSVEQVGHSGKQKASYGLVSRIEAAAETVCREVACEGLATSGGYCRLHYIKNWKKIKRKEIILREKKLNQYIEELVAKYPDKYIEAIRQDLASDKDFAKVIYDLDLDEGVDDFDADNAESADALIDTIKREFDDEGDVF